MLLGSQGQLLKCQDLDSVDQERRSAVQDLVHKVKT